MMENFFSQQSPDPTVGTRLEGLLLDELEDDFNPRAFERSAKEQSKSSSSPVTTGLSVTPPVCMYQLKN